MKNIEKFWGSELSGLNRSLKASIKPISPSFDITSEYAINISVINNQISIGISDNVSRSPVIPNTTIMTISYSNIGIAPQALREANKSVINSKDFLDKYLSFRTINGICKEWLYSIKNWLEEYLNYINERITVDKTLEHIKNLKSRCSRSYYRKRVYQIRKYLTYLGIEWAKDINPPAEPFYYARRVSKDDMNSTLLYFNSHKYSLQFKAFILLGATSGFLAEAYWYLTKTGRIYLLLLTLGDIASLLDQYQDLYHFELVDVLPLFFEQLQVFEITR
jgi:hypothetical protein